MRRAMLHISGESSFDRRGREASGKPIAVHALGLLGANLLIAPPCLLGLAVGHGVGLGTALPYAVAIMALGIIVLRAAMRLIGR